jgi:hypothetical protein
MPTLKKFDYSFKEVAIYLNHGYDGTGKEKEIAEALQLVSKENHEQYEFIIEQASMINGTLKETAI